MLAVVETSCLSKRTDVGARVAYLAIARRLKEWLDCHAKHMADQRDQISHSVDLAAARLEDLAGHPRRGYDNP